jgi:murein DD-endopeptidase MepM/ murein hydrolase activator NlpD
MIKKPNFVAVLACMGLGIFVAPSASAACWEIKNGTQITYIESSSRSTPPVSGAKKVSSSRCSAPAPKVKVPAKATQGPPIAGKLVFTQHYGEEWSRNPTEQLHTGVDIDARGGTEVVAVLPGKVVAVKAYSNKTDGSYVIVQNDDGTYSGYIHVNPAVSRNDRVEKGQKVGAVYSDHLHLNLCKQESGCHHGAFPSPTFSGTKSLSEMNKYYIKPRL